MSVDEQPRPLKGQVEQLDGATVPTESTVDRAKDQPPTDSQPTTENDPPQLLVDADEEHSLVKEATVLNTKDVKTKGDILEPPAIPQRNALRTSQLLDSLRLNSIKSVTKSLTTTHPVYMSSEEDASSSAGEFSEYDYESSSDESEELPIKRKSQEVTARAVSVLFIGKPCVVELATARRSVSPAKRPQSELISRPGSSRFGMDSPRPGMDALRGLPAPLQTPGLAPINDPPKASPSFLSQDPFSNSPYMRRQSTLTIETKSLSGPYSQAPNTPTSAFQRIQKTINLARKRSRPNLKGTSSNNASTSSLYLPSLNASREFQDCTVRADITSSPMQSPVTYNEILKSSHKNHPFPSTTARSSPVEDRAAPTAAPTAPTAPATTKRGILRGLNMNRRRSMKIRA